MTKLDAGVRLEPGDASAPTVREGAEQALRLASVSPEEARRAAAAVEEQALDAADWPAVSVARRAYGVAATQLGQLDEAVRSLERAVEAAARVPSARLAGEARMSLAAALVFRGSTAGGFAAIDTALAELVGTPAARARTQRAALLQIVGRLEEAMDDLRTALPQLRLLGDVEWEVRALINRSGILMDRQQFGAAESDLLRARDLCAEHRLLLASAHVEQNLGVVCGDRGDVGPALGHFDAAAERYAELGMTYPQLSLDRLKVLVSVRLLDEASQVAEAAVASFQAQHRSTELPEAQLTLATVSILRGNRDVAVRAARSAVRDCRRLGRQEWLALARFVALQADLMSASSGVVSTAEGRVSSRRLRSAALALQTHGWQVQAQEALIMAGRQALAEGRPRQARRDLAKAARARRAGPADVRARAWLAEALLRDAEGSRRGAKSALRAGLRAIEDHRATLGASELRAHVSVHRGFLARAGLRIALEEGDARAVHWWGERGRASHDLMRSARPPEDPALAGWLHELRATMTEIVETRTEGQATESLVRRQVALEGKIRDHTRRFPSSVEQTAPPPRLDVLAAQLGDTALVEYVDLDDELHAVTMVDGRVRLHHLGSTVEIQHCLEHLPFALRRMVDVATRPAQLAAACAVVQRAGAVLDRRLIAPLREVVAHRSLVVVPAGWLRAVPWSILPSCAGRPVSVAPSCALWSAAAERTMPRGGVVSIAGPGLPGAAQEARAVSALYPDSLVLTGSGAVASRVARAMEGSRIAHIAAHGIARIDNPLFSSLRLEDGPFTVYDLERLGATPHQVTLAACNAGVSHLTAGQELLGLAAALLGQQTATLVAPVVPIADAETAPVMTEYHRLLRSGRRPAEALALAQEQHALADERTRASAVGFVCLGVG